MMTNFKSIGKAALASLLLLGMSVPASALVVSQTQNFTLDNQGNVSATVNMAGAAINGTKNYGDTELVTDALAFSRFFLPGGQLNGVTITYTTNIQMIGSTTALDNDCERIFFNTICLGNYADDAETEVQYNSGFTLSLVDPATETVMASEFQEIGCLNGGSSQSCTAGFNTGAVSFSGTMDLSGFTLADFKDFGNNPIDFDLSNNMMIAGICTRIQGTASELDCGAWGDSFWSGSITVEYSYDQVPVPATVLLMGLGLAGLGWSRRKAA